MFAPHFKATNYTYDRASTKPNMGSCKGVRVSPTTAGQQHQDHRLWRAGGPCAGSRGNGSEGPSLSCYVPAQCSPKIKVFVSLCLKPKRRTCALATVSQISEFGLWITEHKNRFNLVSASRVVGL